VYHKCVNGDSENNSTISIPLRRFLILTACPEAWRALDLYIFRDERQAFYVGQSYCAYERVWEHLKGGPHGHSIVGRFVLANWPRSGRFTITLLSSRSEQFAVVANNLDASERRLIEELTPCFNIALNQQPAALPEGYLPPNTPLRGWKNFRRMLREAEVAEKAAERSQIEW
jgi:hypothetical protein